MNYGEIINLGSHRLMCGDAPRYEDVIKLVGSDKINLVLTDPPYGMKCQDKNGQNGPSGFSHPLPIGPRNPYGKLLAPTCYHIMRGDNTQDTTRKHYNLIKSFTVRMIIWGGQYFAHFLPVSGGWIFWDKQTGNNDFSDGELAWCSFGKKVRKYTQLWNGIIRAGNYALNPKPRVHPTQKPVELHMKILEDFTQEGDCILDCFGGSGTTLIACEVTNRKCLMMEISPEYCDIIKKRYEDLPLEIFRNMEVKECQSER